jgi:hypothetical protein
VFGPALGQRARKCSVEPHTVHFMTCPSGPIGLVRDLPDFPPPPLPDPLPKN